MKSKIAPYADEMYNNFVFSDPDSYAERCKKKTEWVMRGRVESAFAYNLVFITLTYAPKNLPSTFKRVSSLPCFSQRETRKKYLKLNDTTQRFENKWVTRKSQPLNIKDNLYRTKEIMTEQDFKNAKFRFTQSKEYLTKNNVGLLVPQHLSDFLTALRDDIRKKYNNKNLSLRYIANGEYGQNATRRPHFHILIFNHFKDYDYDNFVKQNWKYAKIYQCTTASTSDPIHVKKLTAYICAHTVKIDAGNTYQNELSPAFRLSCGGEGIGFQLLDPSLMSECNDSYCRSLSFSLSAWNRRSPLKYQVTDEHNTVYEYEFPRYYKDKVLNYNNLDIRQYYTSFCKSYITLITNFCHFANLKGTFDLLPIFVHSGLLKTPYDVLKFFLQINYKKISKNFDSISNYYNFASQYLRNLKQDDEMKRSIFKERYSKRHQNQKYINYCKSKGYNDIL